MTYKVSSWTINWLDRTLGRLSFYAIYISCSPVELIGLWSITLYFCSQCKSSSCDCGDSPESVVQSVVSVNFPRRVVHGGILIYLKRGDCMSFQVLLGL